MLCENGRLQKESFTTRGSIIFPRKLKTPFKPMLGGKTKRCRETPGSKAEAKTETMNPASSWNPQTHTKVSVAILLPEDRLKPRGSACGEMNLSLSLLWGSQQVDPGCHYLKSGNLFLDSWLRLSLRLCFPQAQGKQKDKGQPPTN